jgi:flagellar assembly protein FliH
MRSSTKPIHFGFRPANISLTAPHPGAQRLLEETILQQKLEQAREQGFRAGLEQGLARTTADLQEQRDALSILLEGTLENLGRQHHALIEQVGSSLPQLAMEVAQRVLAGFEPDLKHIGKLVDEVLREVAPSTTQVEVWLCERDLTLIQDISPELTQRHPGLKLLCDPDLRPGDCRARSRFGAIDASLDTKLKNVARSLSR